MPRPTMVVKVGPADPGARQRVIEEGLDLFMAAPVAQAAIDPAGTLHVANHALLELLGVEPEEVGGRLFHGFVVRASRPAWFSHVQEIFATGGSCRVDVEIRSRAGGLRWVRVTSAPLPDLASGAPRALCMVVDISEERAAMQRLRQSEQSFRSLVDRSPEAIFIQKQGRIVYANPSAARLVGAPSAPALRGIDLLSLVHPEDRAEVGERQAQARQSELCQPPMELRLIRLDGNPARAEVVDLGLVFDNERAVVTMARDLSERLELQGKLIQADRLSSMGVLVAGLVHEINNPLMYMESNTELVQEDLGRALGLLRQPGTPPVEAVVALVEESLSCLADVREGERRVVELVRELRGFSRVDDQHRPVQVADVMQAALRVAGRELRFRARVEADLREAPPVVANEGHLFQVFLNLLVNAAQAIPPGSPDDHRVRVGIRQEGHQVVCSVSDTGTGMEPAVVERIFDPFFTTKQVGEGTGLGLSICFRIVRSLGGAIAVCSAPGRGSTFEVRLPVANPERREDGPLMAAVEVLAPEGRRILVVDDEASIRTSLARLLRRRHEVVLAASAQEAVALLERDPTFDLVLCDLLMEDGSGMDLHSWMSAQAPILLQRTVFMTGGAFLPRARRFLDLVGNPVLEKPVSVGQLERLLRDCPPRPCEPQAMV